MKMNIIQNLIIKYCKLRCKPYLNHFSYATPYLCKKIINVIDIPFFIYKYQLIALSYYTKRVDLDTRQSILLSIINQFSYDIPHQFIIKKLINYFFVFPDFSNSELFFMYDYVQWRNLEKQFFYYLSQYFNQDFINDIKSRFLIFKLSSNKIIFY